MCERALDALDPASRRGEARGERAQVIVHLDGRSDGDGHARIHLGPQLPDPLRRSLCGAAKVRAPLLDANKALLGIRNVQATVRTPLARGDETRARGCGPRVLNGP